MLGNRRCDARNINFLKTVFSKQRNIYVTGNRYKRNRIHIGSRYSGYQVGRSRSARRKTYAYFSGTARIAVCGMGRPLFMGSQNMPDLIPVFIQFIIYVQDRSARISEYGVHALFFQALN